MKISRQTIQVNGLPIHYEVAGTGEPIVLVHGLAESTRVWYRILPELARSYHVYLIDLPGFGAMRPFHQQFNLKQSGAWLAAWMQAVGLEAVSVVGHSMGGYVCMAVAALQPDKIARLVLVDSIGIPFHRPAYRLIYPTLKAVLRAHPSFWPYIQSDFWRAGPRTVRRAAQQIARLDATPVIAAVRAPTLLIWGENDDATPLSFGRQLHERLAGSRLLVLPRTSHFPMYERPHTFHHALTAFLQGQDVGVAAGVSSQTGSEERNLYV